MPCVNVSLWILMYCICVAKSKIFMRFLVQLTRGFCMTGERECSATRLRLAMQFQSDNERDWSPAAATCGLPDIPPETNIVAERRNCGHRS